MFDWLFRRGSVSQKVRRVVKFMNPVLRRSMPRESKAYADEGFSRNNVVFRCIEEIAQSIANIPVEVHKGDKHVDNHPLQKLLDNPNPLQSYDEWAEALIAFWLITGNGWCEAIAPSDNSPPLELWNWQPYNFSVVPVKGRPIPKAYMWDDGEDKFLWEVDQLTANSDMMHWKTFNPLDKWMGLSPISAAAWSIDQNNSANIWNQNLLSNNCTPSGILETEEELSDEQYLRLKEQIDRDYSGPGNARKPLIAENGLSWNQLSLSPQEMDWLNGKKVSAADIASTFGVPGQILGIEGSQTFANYEQARLAFYEDTLFKISQRFYGELEQFFRLKYPDGQELTIKPNLDKIPALVVRRKEKFEAANNATFLSINEKRELAGYEPIDDPAADQIWIPAGLLPLTFTEPGNDKPEDDEDTEDGDEEEENEEDDNFEDEEEGVKQLMRTGISREVAQRWHKDIVTSV